MPVDKAKVQRMIDMMDAWLRQREQDQLEGIDDDGDENEPPSNPVDAPPSEPFYSDGPPEKIHGQPESDQELWPPKPRVLVPIETL
jgi:hypothetical protein